MPTKDLHHRLTADSRGFTRGFKSAEQSARALERELARQEARQARVDAAMQRTGTVLLGVGAAITAGLAVATRAAIQWESAWAGVAKTLSDATAPQLAIVEDQLRDLARELPQSHTEIANVAAAAGQLGVRTEDVAAFTETMVHLGVATNLSSEEAAFAIARLTNIMGTARADTQRLASVIVDLGNNSATTEAEITEMALRIAGAGQTVGLSEAQVLSFAAALSSVGIRAESGGTAISRVFLEIDTAVSSGGETLETFAATAGMSAQEFRRAFHDDAGAAMATFIAGLGRVQASGGNVNAVLETLGLTEIRVSDALRRLSANSDLVSTSLETGNRAWDENTALLEEARRRYGTTEAQMDMARNSLNDLAISIGQTFLPVLGEMAGGLGGLVDFIGDLPAGVKTTIGVIGALAATLALAGGAAALTAVQVAKVKGALDLLQNSTGRTAGAVRGLRRGMGSVGSVLAGPVGLALAAATVGLGIFAAKQAKARAEVEQFIDTLDASTGAITNDTRLKLLNKLETEGLADQAAELGISMSDLVDAALDPQSDALGRVREATAAALETQRQLAGEDALLIREHELTQALLDEHGIIAATREEWQRRRDLLDDTADSMDNLSPEAEHLADALGLSAGEAGTLNDELKEMDERLQTLFDNAFGMAQAQDAVTEATRKLVDQVRDQVTEGDKGAASLTGQSEAAIANRRAMEDLLEKQGEHLQQLFEETGSLEAVQDQTETYRDELKELAEELGINEDEVADYIAVLDMIPNTVATSVNLSTAAAEAALRRFNQQLSQTPGFGGFEVRHSGGLVGFGHRVAPDEVPVIAKRGEFVSTVDATNRNRAALEAANAGARLTVAGAGATGVHVGAPDVNLTALIDLGGGEVLQGRILRVVEGELSGLSSSLTTRTGQAR